MRVREISKNEIEKRFMEMNDYLRIEYLKSCLKNQIDFDTRKFVLVKLSGLYEAKGLLVEAGRAMRAAAEINTNQSAKLMDFVKATELFIRGGDYELADLTEKKALAITEPEKKGEMKKTFIAYYRIQARVYVENNKRKQAAGVYEKMLTNDLETEDRKEAQNNLLKLYESLGEFGKIKNLQRRISNE